MVRLKQLLGEHNDLQDTLEHLQQVDEQRVGFYEHIATSLRLQ